MPSRSSNTPPDGSPRNDHPTTPVRVSRPTSRIRTPPTLQTPSGSTLNPAAVQASAGSATTSSSTVTVIGSPWWSFCARQQAHLDGGIAATDQVDSGAELIQRKLVAANPIQRQNFRFDHGDRDRPAVRAEVGAEHVEFLDVADDCPVDGDGRAEHPVLDIAAQLAQQVQPLRD